MKLEFINEENNIIRLYGFNISGAQLFRETLLRLIKEKFIKLEECTYIQSINGIKLHLIVGEKDKGIIKLQETPVVYVCELTDQTWKNAISLLEPFCENEQTYNNISYAWLYNLASSEIEFLFSPSGRW